MVRRSSRSLTAVVLPGASTTSLPTSWRDFAAPGSVPVRLIRALSQNAFALRSLSVTTRLRSTLPDRVLVTDAPLFAANPAGLAAGPAPTVMLASASPLSASPSPATYPKPSGPDQPAAGV